MEKTANFNLNKPEGTDPMRLADFNQNSDMIDAALTNLNSALGAKAEQSAVTALTTAVAAKGNCSIECGTYTGTGTYGESSKNTLTFGIQPKIVFVFNTASYGALAHTSASGNSFSIANQVFYYGGSAFSVYHSEHATTHYTILGNRLSWYNALSARAQMNQSGTTYGYIAIG